MARKTFEEIKEQIEPLSLGIPIDIKVDEDLLLPHLDEIISDRTGRISTARMRLYLRKYERVRISTWKAYQIKGNIEAQYPEKFEEI